MCFSSTVSATFSPLLLVFEVQIALSCLPRCRLLHLQSCQNLCLNSITRGRNKNNILGLFPLALIMQPPSSDITGSFKGNAAPPLIYIYLLIALFLCSPAAPCFFFSTLISQSVLQVLACNHGTSSCTVAFTSPGGRWKSSLRGSSV